MANTAAVSAEASANRRRSPGSAASSPCPCEAATAKANTVAAAPGSHQDHSSSSDAVIRTTTPHTRAAAAMTTSATSGEVNWATAVPTPNGIPTMATTSTHAGTANRGRTRRPTAHSHVRDQATMVGTGRWSAPSSPTAIPGSQIATTTVGSTEDRR